MTGRDRSGSLVLAGWWAGFALVPVPMTGRRAGAGVPSLLLCWPSPLLSPPLCSLPLAVVLCWPCLCVSTMAGGRLGGAVMISGAAPGALVVLGAGRGRSSGQSRQKIKRDGICQNAQKHDLKTAIFLYARLVSNEENH